MARRAWDFRVSVRWTRLTRRGDCSPTDLDEGESFMTGQGITRRRFVAGSAATVAAMTTGVGTGRAAVALREERHRAVVIGSGFGGAVTSLRLTQAGVNVVLLERGRRWPAGRQGVFPNPVQNPLDPRTSWRGTVPIPGSKRSTGLLEYIDGKGMDAVAPACVGGGSVSYMGMSPRPRGDHFATVMPDALDYDEFASTWYPRAEAMLRVARMPDDVLASDRYRSSRRFVEYVRRAGLSEAQPVPMTIDWDVVRRELRGEQRPLISKGDVGLGVNGPGKQSLDTNYLPAAEATGRLDLRPLHDVTAIRRDELGRWIVDVDVLDRSASVVERLRITTDALVLSAGTMNTTKMLLRARETDALPDLPDDVGRYWGTNGDLIAAATLATPTGTWQGGPANMMTTDWDDPEGPVSVLFVPLPTPVETHSMMLVGMVIPDGHGTLTYDAARDRVGINWPKSADTRALAMARARMRRITRAARAISLFDATRASPTTFHQLGGAVLGKVCDAHGRVLGHRGLYVNDGALIPGSTACANPSLTIAALAERNAATIVAQDVGSVF